MGPKPGADAIERLHRVGRQHQLDRSHASATGIGIALAQPLRIRERTDAMPVRSHAGNVKCGRTPTDEWMRLKAPRELRPENQPLS